MATDIFAEGIGEVGFSQGMVRMKLGGQSLIEKDVDGNPKMEVRQQLVMPLQGYLASMASLQDLANKLVEAGVLEKKDAKYFLVQYGFWGF